MRTRPNSRAMVLVLAIVVLAAVVAPACADVVEFPDLPTWNWSWEYVQGVVAVGIAYGYDDGLYRPEVVVTRDQMAVYVARAMCGGDEYMPTGPATATFEDVPNTGYGASETEPYWAYAHVEYAVGEGVVMGYEDGLYHPLEEVTRGQMAVFIARAMCGGEENVPIAGGSPSFPDVPIDSWCYDYVEYIAAEGVTQGYQDGLYHPDDPCSRDQMAVYMCRAFDLPLPPSPYDVTDYFPLGGGDEWVYESPEGVYTKTVSGLVTLHGTDFACMIDLDDDGVEYWRPEPMGLLFGGFYDAEDGTTSWDPALLIPNGLFVGQDGGGISTVYADGTEVGTIDFEWGFVAAEAVTVPAGTFEDCMKLYIRMDDGVHVDQFYLWVARGVGIVKRDDGSFGGDNWEVLLSAEVGRAQYPTNVGPFTIADYQPLGVGTTWAYDSSDGDDVVQVVGVDDVDGIEAARLSEGWTEGPYDAQYFAVIDGALCYVGEYDSDAGEMMVLSPPIAFPVSAGIGDKGSATSTASVGGTPVGEVTLAWAVVGAGPVETTAGRFEDCIKLRMTTTDPSEEATTSYTWFALGVGPVKEDERPFDGTWWRELKWAEVGAVQFPTAEQAFDIQDYADYTVGNTWDYGAATWTVTGTIDEGGETWAATEISTGETRYWRTDETGLYLLGFDYGGSEQRYDPPFHIPAGLSPGDTDTQTCSVSIDGTPVDTTYFTYEFEDIGATRVEAGLFPDCMKVMWTESSSPEPGAGERLYWARGIGLVKAEVGSSSTGMVSAEVNGVAYPRDESTFDVTDYFPLAIGNAWSTIWQGGGSYSAERVLTPSTEDLSGLGVSDTVYRVLRYSGDAAESADFWAHTTAGLARYGHWDPGMTLAVDPPLVTPDGIAVGDSDSGTSSAYVWTVDHWVYAGSIAGEWALVASGAVATSAGYFPDCILMRWEITPPGDDPVIQYVWLAKGIGPVMEFEVGAGEWDEAMGATIDSVAFPDDPAPATPETATITQGAGLGFDFSAGGMAALPDDQDLSYIYTSATEADIESFATSGVSSYIAEGAWGTVALDSYSTFLPPPWNLQGEVWQQTSSVLSETWDSTNGICVVKTREGRYALMRITDATAGSLSIEYVYPYGWFGE